jgi:hypothetical protein
MPEPRQTIIRRFHNQVVRNTSDNTYDLLRKTNDEIDGTFDSEPYYEDLINVLTEDTLDEVDKLNKMYDIMFIGLDPNTLHESLLGEVLRAIKTIYDSFINNGELFFFMEGYEKAGASAVFLVKKAKLALSVYTDGMIKSFWRIPVENVKNKEQFETQYTEFIASLLTTMDILKSDTTKLLYLLESTRPFVGPHNVSYRDYAYEYSFQLRDVERIVSDIDTELFREFQTYKEICMFLSRYEEDAVNAAILKFSTTEVNVTNAWVDIYYEVKDNLSEDTINKLKNKYLIPKYYQSERPY